MRKAVLWRGIHHLDGFLNWPSDRAELLAGSDVFSGKRDQRTSNVGMIFQRYPSLRWFVVALSILPLMLFAYLGQFSRLMSDDYCAIAVGQELGAWEGMRYWYHSWAGSYANFLFKSAIAPLDTSVPAITPAIIVLIWLIGAVWLIVLALNSLQIDKRRWIIAVIVAAALVTASINAIFSPQSFYWFAASTHYTLPLALLTIYFALCLWIVRRQTRARIWLAAITGAVICFLAAGASEIFVAFQLTFVTLSLIPMIVIWRSTREPGLLLVGGAGWLATIIGFWLQINSPGLANRAAADDAMLGHALRNLPKLLEGTLGNFFKFAGHPPAFAGFMLLFAVTLLVARYGYQPPSTPGKQSPGLATRCLALGLLFQLLWMPQLWAHVSDEARYLGRFSEGYALVVGINALLTLGFVIALWQRHRLDRELINRPALVLRFHEAILTIVALLFVMTQLRSIHDRAAAFLFSSAIALLLIGAFQLSKAHCDQQALRLRQFSLYSFAVALISTAAIVFTALYGRGFVDARILSPASFVLVLTGLVCGATYGMALERTCHSSQSSSRFTSRLSMTVVLIISTGILLGNARLIPGFQRYAQDWDARHQRIVAMRDSGQLAIEVAPLAFDLANYVEVTTLGDDPSNRCALRYYGIDSLTVNDS